MEIIKNLWQVGGGDLTAPEDAAIYLIRFEHQAALIDSGCGRAHDRLTANISKVLPENVQITYLFLTHCHNHYTWLNNMFFCSSAHGMV